MSKLRQQRRGKGTSLYRCSKTSIPLLYPKQVWQSDYTLKKILKDGTKNAPIGLYVTTGGQSFYNVAPLSVYENQTFSSRENKIGKISLLKDIPSGMSICNIGTTPYDRGKLCRAAGTAGKIINKTDKLANIKIGHRNIKLSTNCVATIGVCGNGGAKLKPLLKAGTNFKRLKGTGHRSFTVSAKNKNHHEHPFGASTSKSPGRAKTCSRHAPPGAKVGSIAARRTGKK